MKNKKIIVFILLAIILIVLGIIFIPKFFTKDQPSSTTKTFNVKDEISIDDLKNYFKDIYYDYDVFCAGLIPNYESSEAPITRAYVYDENNINIHFSSDTIIIDMCYNRYTNKLHHLNISLINSTNERTYKSISSISYSSTLASDKIDGLDLSICNGIMDALKDDSTGLKYIYNKYKDKVWAAEKTMFTLDNGDQIISLYIQNVQK